MNITIGIRDASAPLHIETDMTPDAIKSAVYAAVTSGEPLSLTDADGSLLIVPVASLGFVKIEKQEQRRVGFGFV